VIVLPQDLESVSVLPEVENRSFEARKIDFRGHLVEVRPHSRETHASRRLITTARKRNYLDLFGRGRCAEKFLTYSKLNERNWLNGI
jgi:hypothetical protein